MVAIRLKANMNILKVEWTLSENCGWSRFPKCVENKKERKKE